MNKDFQLQQLNIMLMDPGVKSGLYLLDTDLTDEEIKTHIRSNNSFKYISGNLIQTSKGNVFELFLVGLCHQCQNGDITALRDQLMTADEQRKDVIIYSLAIQILKHFSTSGKAVIHMLGRIDLSSIELEDLDKLNAALNCIDDTIVVICTHKNREKPMVEYVINKSLKGYNNNKIMENRLKKLKKVYISYKHDENYNGAMEAIKRGLEKNGIYYSIDVQDIKYRDDIVKYEKEIGSADKVIMFITASYLKSIDCMFEMTEIFKNSDVRNRVFPVVDMQPIPRNIYGLKEIKDYWSEQKVHASIQIQTEPGSSDFVISELLKIDAIIKNLDDFWYYLVHINTGSFKDMIDNDAALLMEEIQRVTARKTAELEEKIISMGENQPTVIRQITQNGEKSVYVEKNIGTININ